METNMQPVGATDATGLDGKPALETMINLNINTDKGNKMYTPPAHSAKISMIEFFPTAKSFRVNRNIWIKNTVMRIIYSSLGLATNTSFRHLYGSVLKYDMEEVKAGQVWINENTGESGVYQKDGHRFWNFELEPSPELAEKLNSTEINVMDFMAEF